MKITSGLLAGQVLQRDEKNRGGATIAGASTLEGTVEARVSSARGPLRGNDWREVGTAAKKRFTATLERIPAGGPYTVELRIAGKPAETLAVGDIYVGDVWFLAGQSNMQGVGNLEDSPKPHPLIRAFYMRDEWDLAAEPLHYLGEAVDSFHNNGDRQTKAQAAQGRKALTKGVCPGLFFGRQMLTRTKVPQGLVLCAHGGTSMAQWSPELKGEGGKSLYGAMLRRFKKLGQPARGILWYQGESDAGEPALSVYTQKMIELVAETRADFGQPELPWVVVQIGRVIMGSNPRTWYGEAQPWNSIQEQERRLPEVIDNLDVVPTVDLSLDDVIHISGKSYAVLGERMARVADRIALGNRKEKPAIQVAKIEAYQSAGPHDPIANGLRVHFANVVGGLHSVGRPSGFSIVNADSDPLAVIYNTRLERDSVILETTQPATSLEMQSISYGHGFDPFCNITDGRGMGLPAFGPIPIRGHGGMPFLKNWTVTGPQVRRGGVRAASPEPEATLADTWREPFSTTGLLVMPQDFAAAQPGVFYLRTSVTAASAFEAILSLGSDSPFKAWLNGKVVTFEAAATNPSLPDQYKVPVQLQEGTNELMIAFDGRGGKGWGISARFLPADDAQDLKSLLTQ